MMTCTCAIFTFALMADIQLLYVFQMDTYHRGAEQGPDFERIKTDIRHLHLGALLWTRL